MEGFLSSLERARVLTNLRVRRLKFSNKSVLNPSFANVLQKCPLKKLVLYINRSSNSNIVVTAETLRNLFFALSHRKMEHIHISLSPEVSNNTSSSEMVKMGEGFTEFLKAQTSLSYLDCYLNFRNSQKKVNIMPFSFIP